VTSKHTHISSSGEPGGLGGRGTSVVGRAPPPPPPSPDPSSRQPARSPAAPLPTGGSASGTEGLAGLDSAPGWADKVELDRFEAAAHRYLAGELDAEDFRRMRLRHGVYGQRQLTDVHMVRVKIPGGALTAAALEALADVAGRWSRGWGHLTTRQNLQFHFISIRDVPAVLRRLAAAGLTTREACGDAVRNVTACPLAGVCRSEVLDVSAAAEAVARHFLRSPLTQDLPRKFKIAASGCARDCALTGIHDLGILATDRDGRAGFRLVLGGGLGTAPRQAHELEPFTDPADLVVTAEAVLRVWAAETPDRAKRARTRLKFLVAKLGIDAFRDKVLAQRDELRSVPGYALPPEALLPPREPAMGRHTLAGSEQGSGGPRAGAPLAATQQPGTGGVLGGYPRWRVANVVGQRQHRRYAAFVTAPFGDLTEAQFRALAAAASQFGITWRTTVRQNLVARNLTAADLPCLFALLASAGLGGVSVGSAADVATCPGAETCNLALTASRGAAEAIARALDEAGLAEVPATINVSGCPNSCAQPQVADIGLTGQVRRSGLDESPGYRILLGGGAEGGHARFGAYVAKVPARLAPGAVAALVGRYASERAEGERFGAWAERDDQPALHDWLGQFDDKRTRQEAPELYTDWGGSAPFEVILGRGECAS
jgi:sulfite reductase (ferredoxin)